MELRILIIDDEDIIRDGLAKKIQRLFPDAVIAGKASDGYEALKLIGTQRPNIVITDVSMPEMDGLQFISIARNIDKHMKFVIVSGFHDFEYARTAIKLGVEDYLVKPIENAVLADLIRKLGEKLEKEQQDETRLCELKRLAGERTDYYKNKYFTDLVSFCNEIDISDIEKNLDIIGVQFPFPCFTVVHIAVSSYEGNPMFPHRKDIPLLKFAIRNIAEEVLAACGMAAAFENLRSPGQILAVVNHKGEECSGHIEPLKALCGKLAEALHQHLSISAMIGIGRSCCGIENVSSSYYSAYNVAMYRMAANGNRVICAADLPGSGTVTYFIPDDRKLMLNNAIKNPNRKLALEVLEKVLEPLEKGNFSYANIRTVYIDLAIQLIKSVKEAGGTWENIFSQDILSEAFLAGYSSLEQLKEWLQSSIDSICSYIGSLRRSEGKRSIEEIQRFIDNYYYTDITLNSLAARYFMNPNYLSQLFKNEAGMNFIDYLTEVRIEKAADLLKHSDIKVFRVSEMVGYTNHRYFSELFQKLHGMTPSEFRRSCRQA